MTEFQWGLRKTGKDKGKGEGKGKATTEADPYGMTNKNGNCNCNGNGNSNDNSNCNSSPYGMTQTRTTTAKDGYPARAKAVSGLGNGVCREAGFSAALLTMRLRAASVEMTEFRWGLAKIGKDKSKSKIESKSKGNDRSRSLRDDKQELQRQTQL